MYGLKYIIPFKTINDVSAVVNVEEENYVGSVTELTAGSSPFTITLDEGDDLYSPLKLSTAKLCVVGGDYLQDLFSTEYQKHRITCILNNKVIWTGFIKPEMYTQDYVTDVFELELECISPVYTLEKKKYVPKSADGTKTFVSLWWLLNMGYQQSAGNYSGLFLPKSFQKSASDSSNVLDSLTVSEKNFFDEDGTAWYVKDVLEEIMKLLGWTLHDWNGSFCMQDLDDENSTICTENLNGDLIASGIIRNSVNVQDLGFSGSNHTLDVLAGFNKVSVKCSNYAVSDLLPSEDFSNYEKLTGLISEEGYDTTSGSQKTTSELGAVYLIKPLKYENAVYTLFIPDDSSIEPTWLKLTPDEIKSYASNANICFHDNRKIYQGDVLNGVHGQYRGLFGALPFRYCVYAQDKERIPSITDYSFSDMWYFRMTDAFLSKYSLYNPNTAPSGSNIIPNSIKPILTIKCDPACFSDGAFSLVAKIHLNMFIAEEQTITPKYEGKLSPFNITSKTTEFFSYEFAFSLRIGDYYFHCNYEQELDPNSPNFKKLKYGKKAFTWNKDSSLTGNYIINGSTIPCRNIIAFDRSVLDGGHADYTESDFGNHFFDLMSIRELTDDYNGLSGLIIPLPENIILCGDLEMTFYTPHAYVGALGAENIQGIHLTDFSFKYGFSQSWTSASNQADRVYQNVVNSEYINERDEIELKISSYNNDGSCYSKVVFGDKYLTNNLFYVPTHSFVRPEELLIKRYVSRYNHTRLKLKEDIKYSSLITPYSTLTDDFEAGKNFALTGGEIDLKNEKFSVIMTEL